MSFELHVDGCIIDSVLCLIEIPGVSPLLSFCDQPDLGPKLLTSARETSRMDRLCKVLKLYFLNLFFIEVQLNYSVVLMTAIEQSDLVIYTYINVYTYLGVE